MLEAKASRSAWEQIQVYFPHCQKNSLFKLHRVKEKPTEDSEECKSTSPDSDELYKLELFLKLHVTFLASTDLAPCLECNNMFIALLVCCYIQDGEGSQILRWDKKVGTISGWVLHLWHNYSELANTVCVGPITQQINNMNFPCQQFIL